MATAETMPDALIRDSEYLGVGQRWEDDLYRSLRRSRSLAWLVAIVAGVLALVALLCLALLVPLKQFEPYVVTVDKTTGYLEITRPLKQSGLDQSEAITVANVIRFIRARETYDSRLIRENFDLAALYSAQSARDDLVAVWTQGNASRPDKLFGKDTSVSVFAKSATFLNAKTVQVRFDTTQKTLERETAHHWIATIKFRYVNEPQKNEWRFDNPTGFQVVDYRRDQEAFSTVNDTGKLN